MTNPTIKRNRNGRSTTGLEERRQSSRECKEGTRQRDRRSFLKGVGALGAGLWMAPAADAFALPEDKIKVVRYFSNPGDAQGRQGQPMVNQSSNVVIIETERRRIGIGEGGEPRTMEECASMLIGLDPFRIDNHVAAHDARVFLSGGARKTSFAGRAWIWLCGTSRPRRWTCRCGSC